MRPESLIKAKPHLIAIVGGSGSGKTWLADRLKRILGGNAMRLSLDDFYHDRSHLSAKRRSKINFDHPRAIDWNEVRRVLETLSAGRAARIPQYDFATHSRRKTFAVRKPKPLIIMDGLWLLGRREIRPLFSCGIFLDAPQSVCLERRLKRDCTERNRSATDIRRQFFEQVAPMHERFVASQLPRVNVVLKNCDPAEITPLVAQLKTLLKQKAL